MHGLGIVAVAVGLYALAVTVAMALCRSASFADAAAERMRGDGVSE